jgi:hypothetical protein
MHLIIEVKVGVKKLVEVVSSSSWDSVRKLKSYCLSGNAAANSIITAMIAQYK